MTLWIVVGALAFLGMLEGIRRYIRTPLKPRPSQLDRCFVSDDDWVGLPML